MNARMRFAGFLKMAVGAVAASSSSMKMSWERGGDFTMQPRRRTLALVKLPICLFLLVVPLLLGEGVPRALADSFTFTTIDAPGGNKGSQASGINIAGQIVGAFETVGLTGECMDVGECFAGPSPDCLGEPQPPIEHAFCGPEVDNTYCIFDDYFSGYCIVESFHGYLRSPDGSSFTTIDVPGAFYTYAKGVNGAGQIVGRFEPGGAEVAFRRDTDGSFTTIDVPGACCSGAEGINDSGQIVGHFTDNTSYTTHGFMRCPDCSNFTRSEEHTSELQSLAYLVCRLLLEKKKRNTIS